MTKILFVFFQVVYLLVFSGCSTNSVHSSGAIYHEAAFNDQNKAPGWMVPSEKIPNQPQLDVVHIRSQADYHFALGEIYSLERKHMKAIQEFKNTLIYDNEASLLYMRLATEYIKVNLFTEALEYAQESIKLSPKNVDSRLLLGGLYSSLRMFSEALHEYRSVLKLDPKNLEAPLYIGAVYAEKKQFFKAISYFKSLAENRANKSAYKAHYYMSRVYEEWKGSKSRRIEVNLKKALKSQPGYEEAVLSLGKFYLRTQASSKARVLYSSFQDRYGPKVSVARPLSRLYLESKEYDLAYEQLDIIDKGYQKDFNIKLKMALILMERKKYEKAAYKLEEIISQVPDSDKILFYLGYVYEEMGRYKESLKYYSKVPSVSRFYGDSVTHSSYLYKLKGQMNKAIAIIEKGLSQRQDIVQFYSLYASLLDDSKQYTKAIRMLNQAVNKFPKNAQLRFFQGFIYDKLGNKKLTISSMNKVLELDKDHIQGLNYLAYTYAEQGKKLILAEKLVLRALLLKPNDGYVMDTYGLILYKRGRLRKAAKVLEAAHKSVPLEGIVAEHLADTYYQLQLVSRAKEMYLKAMGIEKDESKIQRIRKKLSTIVFRKQPVDNRFPASSLQAK